MEKREMNSSSEGEYQEEAYESPDDNKKELKFDEDNALEIIDLEFRDLEDWVRRETRRVKRDCYDVVECLKVKQSNYLNKVMEDDYEDD